LKHNVDTFRDETSGPEAAERVRAMVDLLRLRRRRHLTMRDVRSLISHLLFRDRPCEEIPALLAAEDTSRVHGQASNRKRVPPMLTSSPGCSGSSASSSVCLPR
jgi:hypothetical protein